MDHNDISHKPYQQTQNIYTSQQNRISQHSLSPEKLGVVGYVKDVACFLKDIVYDHQEKKRTDNEKQSHENETQTNKLQDNHTLASVATELFPMEDSKGLNPEKSLVNK